MLSFLNATSGLNTFSNTKCAEIYCQTLDHFSIICTFCELKTFEFDDFLVHFKNVHLENNESPEVTIKCEIETTPTELEDAYEFYEELQDIKEFNDTSNADLDGIEGSATTSLANDKKWNDEKEYNGNNSSVNSDESQDDEEYAPPTILKAKPKNLLPAKHKCNDCTKSYKLAKCLEHHINKCHNKNKVFKCKKCNIEFGDERALNSHATVVHNGFSCDQCSKKYKSKRVLQMHALIHTGERNFVCDQENCKKAFFNSKHLNNHKRSVHTERNYICETCGYQTKQKPALVVHKRSHTGEKPFACKQCDRKFASRSLLVEHMAMHRTDRPHKCEVCGATFARPKALYHHKHLHLDIKKFICKICGKSYAQAAGLAGHMRQHKSEQF